MKSNFIKGILYAALMGGAVNSFAGPGMADGGAKFLGNITTRGQVQSDFGTYWNQITAENECKWASIEGTRGRYNWSGCDACYNWAKKNGGKFKFHALVWGSQYPNWLNGLSTDETKKAITAWFDAVAAHYPDSESNDVVNEAIKSGGSYHSGYGRNNNIIPALGGDNGNYEFVATAFKMARERWPKAILIYNDYNTFRWQINEGIDLVNKLVKQGAPVDAYGQQAHDLTDMNATISRAPLNKIQNSVKNAKGEPMPLFITEYDIGTDNDNQQKQRYSEQIPAFWESPQVAGHYLWGYIYGATWTTNGNSGLIKNGSDRPAMTWLKQYFKEHLKDGKDNTGLFAPYVPPERCRASRSRALLWQSPGKIEVEDFDITASVKRMASQCVLQRWRPENHGDSDYRKSDASDVDIYKKATGNIVGYNTTGDWLEYSVDIAEAGDYTATASVAADGSGSFKLSIDGKSVGEFDVTWTGSSWDNFIDVKKKVTLPAGKHTLRMDVTAQYFDIDYINFTKGDEEPPISIQTQVRYEYPEVSDYYVFDVNGVRIGRMSAYTMDEAVATLKNTSAIKVQGLYISAPSKRVKSSRSV
uniref:Beta-xylanase n=1 Tax=Fibrobacter succinogenes (strain ATCC 19169 / S85) TaxID=59374 RepID=Q9F107_FIBSS|nr:family 10 glycosyl hydrolase XynB [Fibrobacter succinogenes subsp. succinogenes S85]